jgi:acyl dehydratase
MAAHTLPVLENLASAVNYGFDRIRFIAPVPSGSRVRAHFTLLDAAPRSSGQVLVRYRVSVEVEGGSPHALTADWLSLIFVSTGN